MHEILRNLRSGSFVLDLGSATGSFPADATAARAVRVDRDASADASIRADAAHLPFADHSFAAVISNHSLEHFDDLSGALAEVRRVIVPDGALFVAVPDAATLTDKLYRWLARGGGHVNEFTSASDTADVIARAVGLPHVATRTLCSSLSFLNRKLRGPRLPRRLLVLGGGSEWSLFLYAWLSRRLDLWFGTRTSIYGWAFWFGNIPESVDTSTWPNVCICCGAGFHEEYLAPSGLLIRVWKCPQCGVRNPFFASPVVRLPRETT